MRPQIKVRDAWAVLLGRKVATFVSNVKSSGGGGGGYGYVQPPKGTTATRK